MERGHPAHMSAKREQSLSALRELWGQDARAPLRLQTRPGSLLNANSPEGSKQIAICLEDKLSHELRAPRVIQLIRSNRLAEGAG